MITPSSPVFSSLSQSQKQPDYAQARFNQLPTPNMLPQDTLHIRFGSKEFDPKYQEELRKLEIRNKRNLIKVNREEAVQAGREGDFDKLAKHQELGKRHNQDLEKLLNGPKESDPNYQAELKNLEIQNKKNLIETTRRLAKEALEAKQGESYLKYLDALTQHKVDLRRLQGQ